VVAEKGVLTSEASTEDDDGGNGSKVREEAPSSVPELHSSATDIRPDLASDEKQENKNSTVAAEVARVIHGGGQSSAPMIPIPRAKGALWGEDHRCKRNHQMMEQNGN
jgi:hypothetical protein